ncbi:hypothetical protein ACE1ET_09370 [Saccharicrinis sp. FJH62]|uniref:hypothetical protein n=1 Tax=Saccharicrinis sp. FJH62 TaxID=3344657 RepID=UPI0035D46F30
MRCKSSPASGLRRIKQGLMLPQPGYSEYCIEWRGLTPYFDKLSNPLFRFAQDSPGFYFLMLQKADKKSLPERTATTYLILSHSKISIALIRTLSSSQPTFK